MSSSSSSVEEIKSRYQTKMITELNKFLAVYNELTGSTIQFSISDYPSIIRSIGGYVSKLNINRFDESSLYINSDFSIDMKTFVNTPYEKKVREFLITLKDAFHDTLYDDMIQFLLRTDEFTDSEKQLCRTFLDKLDALNIAMKHTMFDDVTTDVFSQDTIRKKYHEELRSFNEYTRQVATDRDKARVIQRFDGLIKKIASEKVPSEIFFDA